MFLFSLAGLPLLFVDGVLLYLLPARVAAGITATQGYFLLGGAVAYLLVHFLVRKPERMYLWAHEFTHLLAAKLFLRRVHGFHITSRSGGKVVIDRTNVAIDLAPYAVPLYNFLALLLTIPAGGGIPHVRKLYLGAAAYLFTMHLCFSAEGFLDGQPDVRRSGRIFSLAVVALAVILWTPLLAAPASASGFSGVPALYRDWIGEAVRTAVRLSARLRTLP